MVCPYNLIFLKKQTMKTNYLFKFLLASFLFVSAFFYSQKYIVDADNLNVRESANKNSPVLFQLNKGVELNAIQTNGDWIEIKYSDKIGFVNKKFLKEINDSSQKGFKYGFNKAVEKISIPLFCIVFAISFLKKRKRDARFSSGYRQGKVNEISFIIILLISILITFILSTFIAICFWVVNLF